MASADNHVVFGPPGRRIVRLAASPNGKFLALQHVPQNYSTADYHWLYFRRSGNTFEDLGEIPGMKSRRLDVAPLDDGRCLLLEEENGVVFLTPHAQPDAGGAKAIRWKLGGTLSFVDATLRVLPSGREALVLITDRDDKQVDWGGGPPPDYIQTWLHVDLATGKTESRGSETQLGDPPLPSALYGSSRGTTVLAALGAPAWVGVRDSRDSAPVRELITGLPENEYAIHAGRRRLLTSKRVIDIASRQTVLQLGADPGANRFEPQPRFHDLSPDENYAPSTVAGGHFALWNVAKQSAWQPALPAHGGVHNAIFLRGGRVVLGTRQGGVIVVDCAEGIAPADAAW